MSSSAYLFALIPAFVVILYYRRAKLKASASQPDTGTTRPSPAALPTIVKHNDKLVKIKDVSFTDLKTVLTGFCNLYNKERYQAMLRLIKLSEREFAIIFPYDIEFDIFCYLINYLVYPVELTRRLEVVAWATTRGSDCWITEKNANKKIMLFVPADDTAGDNVYMTTEDNTGYKLGFGLRDRKMVEPPVKRYMSPEMEISEFENKEDEDIK